MKIDIVAWDGSPVGTVFQDIYGRAEDGRVGLGGAELALHTMCELWHDAGHEVRLYNSPRQESHSPYKQLPVGSFDPQDDRDVFINFRSPWFEHIQNIRGKKIWWSCDQYTTGDYAKFSTMVDKIVCISPFHMEFFTDRYGIPTPKMVSIDIPLREWDFTGKDIQRIPFRFIFTSVPDRGLHVLRTIWDDIIRKYPVAELFITSDYRLWNNLSPNNSGHVSSWTTARGVRFVGAVNREQYIDYLRSASVLLYPCVYDELFCISAAEAIYAGVIPLTSDKGALRDTNKFSLRVDGNPQTEEWRFRFLNNLDVVLEDLPMYQKETGKLAKRFSNNVVLNQWNKVLNG